MNAAEELAKAIIENYDSPLQPNPKTPLEGILLLSSSYVIAGPSIGRAMLHDADAFNVWWPSDVEHTLSHYPSHVGVRSTKLDLGNKQGLAKFDGLLSEADVLVTNRRAGWREQFTPAEVIKERPGLIDTQMTWAKPGRGQIASASTSRPRSRWASTTLRVTTRRRHMRRSSRPATTQRVGSPPRYPLGITPGCEEGRKRPRPGFVGTHRFLAPRVGYLRSPLRGEEAGESDEHPLSGFRWIGCRYPDGSYSGVKEIEMSKTRGEYKHPLTRLGWWQPCWL